jgi:glycerol-3-phosphate acyltransferase PlsY
MAITRPYSDYGSKNPEGATECFEKQAHKKLHYNILLGDALKGLVAVLIAGKLFVGQVEQSWVLPVQ